MTGRANLCGARHAVSAPHDVLIVEDDAMTASAFARWLRMEGLRVLVAQDVGSALRLLSAGLGGLLVDISLPDGSGFDVIQAARRVRATLPVIVVTGELNAQTINRVHLLNVALAIKPDVLSNLRYFAKRCLAPATPRAVFIDELVRAHRLTSAERRVVECALESTRRAVLVRKLDVTENTVKTQIRSLLNKTGAGSLDELVTPLRGQLSGSLIAQP
jgi:DNA-binding NarL/FixJ family response regulator